MLHDIICNPRPSVFFIKPINFSISIIYQRKLGPPSKRQSIFHKQKRHRNQQCSHTPQQAHRRSHSQLIKHWFRHKRHSCSHKTPKKRIRRRSTSSIQLIRIDQEIDTLLKNDVETSSDKPGCDNRYWPRNRWLGRLAEPKETDCEEETANCHRSEMCFGDRSSACCGRNACIATLVGEINDHGGEDTDKQGDKWEC